MFTKIKSQFKRHAQSAYDNNQVDLSFLLHELHDSIDPTIEFVGTDKITPDTLKTMLSLEALMSVIHEQRDRRVMDILDKIFADQVDER